MKFGLILILKEDVYKRQVLVMPGRFIDHEMAEKILDEFFNSGFAGGRHQKRIEKIPVK